jgi:hypothetical protein
MERLDSKMSRVARIGTAFGMRKNTAAKGAATATPAKAVLASAKGATDTSGAKEADAATTADVVGSSLAEVPKPK